MFTIKVFHNGGHSMIECEGYSFVNGVLEDGLPITIDRLEYTNNHGDGCVIGVGADTIYVMNSAGKTVANYQPYTPEAPMRWAVDPDCARRMASDGNEHAKRYLSKIGGGVTANPLP